MAYIIKMPKLGLEMEQGTVLEWYADPGDEVAEGDMLVEVESEKSIGEVDAREDGAIRRIFIEEGASVPPGTPIGILAAPDADIGDLEAEAEAELEAEAPDAVTGGSGGGDSEATEEVVETAPSAAGDGAGGSAESATAATAATQTAEQKVSPRARQRADDLGVDLATVDGTGFEGAVTEEDVEAAAESEPTEAEDVQASPRARKRAEELDVDLSAVEGTGFDGAVTEEDVEAAAETDAGATTAPDMGVQVAADDGQGTYQRTTAVADPVAGEALVETMEAVRTAFEERVTMTDVLVVVVSAALTDEAVLNGTYTEATHQVQDTQHIALVTDSEGERRAGVVEDAAGQSLTDIVETRQAIGGSEAAAGAAPTFTLATAADSGVTGRLVNPPAVAALTVDATGQRAVPTDDGVDLQPLVTASLTYDTRAVGRTEAQAFLDTLFERANRASELVLESYRGTE